MVKGQVSLEYLMTYGIAIAIVVIAVAALYSMGVFSPSSATVPCSPCFANFAYVDYASGSLVLKNGGRDINNVNCTWSGGSNFVGNISKNQQFTVTGISTSSSAVDLTLTYIDRLSGLYHTDAATIHN